MELWVDISEIIRNAGLAIAALVGAVLAWQRLRPEATQAELARRAHVADLFDRSVSQLTSEHLEVRLGAVYVLGQIARDFPDLTYPVYEITQAFLRQRPNSNDGASEDIQAAIKLLSRLRDNP